MIVGIDLGTTNTVVAYDDGGVPRLFDIPQLVDGGELEARPLLPSALFTPLSEPAGDQLLHLDGVAGGWICGLHARTRAGEIATRAVTSAKSWLSYAGVDRRANVLPYRLAGDPAEDGDDDEVPRLSPLDAAMLVLRQVQRAWDAAHPEHPLSKQDVILTVPASFDAVARTLTVEAAQRIGMAVRLLEEPQAAFYERMRQQGDALFATALGEADEARVLVCDVGGGTTDLSLMRVRREAGEPQVERIAVGRHLLLGGDNMDLALAHMCEQRLRGAGEEKLDERRFQQLVAACRVAKEQLLAPAAPAETSVTLTRRGSQLVGATRSVKLARDEVRTLVLDGFLPLAGLDDPPRTARSALVAFGLPYERDVALTRHVAAFIRRHADAGLPTALLLNGGVFRADAVAARMREAVNQLVGAELTALDHGDLDTAVAQGAVSYGLALAGRGRRIVGGAAKSYVMRLGGTQQAVCVLPRGSQEGEVQRVDERHGMTLELVVGKRVRFDLFASDKPAGVGELVALTDHHEPLAPLVTKLADYEGQGSLPVAIEAELSAIGTLDLRCVEKGADKARRFALAFDLAVAAGARPAHEEASAQARYGKRLEAARAAIGHVFKKSNRTKVAAKEVKGLLRELERILNKRSKWDAGLTRALYDTLWLYHRGRRTSPDHERMFWLLAGFCLRPGVGHAQDDERVAGLFELFEQRLAHPEPRTWQQFWICWRRVAAGLDEAAQARLRKVVDPFLAPAEVGLKQPKPFRNDQTWEMLELATSLESVEASRRGELGGWIIERTWTERDHRLWAGLGRVGARMPIYGSAHHVVAARTIERWMDHLLREKWDTIPTAARAAIAMCRVTGDRARDLSDETRDKVAKRLAAIGLDEERVRPVRELVAIDDADRADFYGEGLPVGLRLSS